jgi:hypothetical protein
MNGVEQIEMIRREFCVIVLLSLAVGRHSAAQQSESENATMVSRQTLVMTHPSKHVPSGTVVDGPILAVRG